ncbi:hypothetical protein [uncultured Oscillibacter sp.]|uniref:hypothetical protein n=1 Tax=uncultured Oscillibacter sp. TaxID=876091 RepID=UPI0026179271|nr:hypothetical protein [uncultured Oscillibacter sp.]
MGKHHRKPKAYLKQYYNGYFMFERAKVWIATDTFENFIASGRTREECEAECRRKGYRPVRE